MSRESIVNYVDISQVVHIRSAAEKAGKTEEALLPNVVQVMRGRLFSTGWEQLSTGFPSNKVS